MMSRGLSTWTRRNARPHPSAGPTITSGPVTITFAYSNRPRLYEVANIELAGDKAPSLTRERTPGSPRLSPGGCGGGLWKPLTGPRRVQHDGSTLRASSGLIRSEAICLV